MNRQSSLAWASAMAQPSALPGLRFAPSEVGLYHEQLNFEHIQHFILLPCSSRSYYILADSQSQLISLQPMRYINALNFTASASTSCSCWPTCHSPRHAVNTAREHRRQPARQLRGCCSTTTCSPLCSSLFWSWHLQSNLFPKPNGNGSWISI